jgi:hypothetical protein
MQSAVTHSISKAAQPVNVLSAAVASLSLTYPHIDFLGWAEMSNTSSQG